jgi:hypothetical protein
LPAGEQGEPEDLALSEIFKRHKDTWVAMTVTARDKNFQPTRGKVVATNLDRYGLRQKLLKYADICILYAGEPPYPLFL